MLIALLIAIAVLVGLVLHVRQLNRRLQKYEFVDGPRILEIPIEFRPCPDCGSPLWGGITPERLPLTPSTFRFVTAIDPRRVAADGTPVVEELRDVQPSEVDDLYVRFEEIGWCAECHKLQPAKPSPVRPNTRLDLAGARTAKAGAPAGDAVTDKEVYVCPSAGDSPAAETQVVRQHRRSPPCM